MHHTPTYKFSLVVITLMAFFAVLVMCSLPSQGQTPSDYYQWLLLLEGEQAATVRDFRIVQRATVPADGQLSPRGQWRWSARDWEWQPVASTPARQPAIGKRLVRKVIGKQCHGTYCTPVYGWVYE